MQILLKTPPNHSDEFDKFIILEFQGVIENAKENWNESVLGSIEKIDNVRILELYNIFERNRSIQ